MKFSIFTFCLMTLGLVFFNVNILSASIGTYDEPTSGHVFSQNKKSNFLEKVESKLMKKRLFKKAIQKIKKVTNTSISDRELIRLLLIVVLVLLVASLLGTLISGGIGKILAAVLVVLLIIYLVKAL